MNILDRQCANSFKAGVHVLALGVASLMGLYNALAWIHRRERHSAFNTGLYGLAMWWELKQIRRHLVDGRGIAEEAVE